MFIPSEAISEIRLDVRDLYWYMLNSSYFNIENEIPFFKLLVDMVSLRMRYFQRINANRVFLLQIIIDLGHVTTCFILGSNKLKELSKDLLAMGDIETLDYCLEVYRQHLNHKKLDSFIAIKWELRETLQTIERVLFNLELNLNKIFTIMYSLFPKNSNFRKDLWKTEELFKNDLITQLKKFIRKDGNYSSRIYGEKGLFLERGKYTNFFDGGVFFNVEKNLVLKNLFNKKFFIIKNFY